MRHHLQVVWFQTAVVGMVLANGSGDAIAFKELHRFSVAVDACMTHGKLDGFVGCVAAGILLCLERTWLTGAKRKRMPMGKPFTYFRCEKYFVLFISVL